MYDKYEELRFQDEENLKELYYDECDAIEAEGGHAPSFQEWKDARYVRVNNLRNESFDNLDSDDSEIPF